MKIELLDGMIIHVLAYDEMADKCFRELIINDCIFINGILKDNIVEVIALEKL